MSSSVNNISSLPTPSLFSLSSLRKAGFSKIINELKLMCKENTGISLSSYIFLFIIFIDFCCVSISCIAKFLRHSISEESSPIFLTSVAWVLFILLFYVGIDSIHNKNTLEYIGFVVFCVVTRVLIFILLWNQLSDIDDPTNSSFRTWYLIVNIFIPILVQLLCIVGYVGLFMKSFYKEFNPKRNGEEKEKKKIKNIVEYFVISYKVDLIATCIIIALYFYYLNYDWMISYVTLFLYLAVSILLFFLFNYRKKKSYKLIGTVLVFNVISALYFPYKVFVVWIDTYDVIKNPYSVGSDYTYRNISLLITIFSFTAVAWKAFFYMTSFMYIIVSRTKTFKTSKNK